MTESPTIAVTGAAGYIGSRVIQEIQRVHPDWEITALDNFYRGQVRTVGDIDINHIDVRDRAWLERTLAGADVVLHLAAISGVDDCDANPDLAYEVNVHGTENVAYFCRQTGASLVFPFSMAVIGDPEEFPITVDHPRHPLNWYGRTKYISERALEAFATDELPVICLMKSNVYGDHVVDGQRITKGTVINFFVDRALAGEPLTVYSPGTQARNYLHVKDAAHAYIKSAERLLDLKKAGETGAWKYEIASDEDPSVHTVAESVQSVVIDVTGNEPPIEIVDNPRGNETLVTEFEIKTSRARDELDWEPTHTVQESIRELVEGRLQ